MTNSKLRIAGGAGRLGIWLKAVRVPFFTATILPVILGSALGWYDTSGFLWLRFWMALAGTLLIHAGTNLANDYFDHLSGCDEANASPTPFSGGSRMIQKGMARPKDVLYVSLILFIMGGAIGIYLNHVSGGNAILILGMIGVFLGFCHSIKPLRINYGTLGELAVGIGFGPLIVLGSYYVQAQTLPLKVFFISIPVGILIACVLFINEFPDYLADKTSDKRTLVVVLGKRRAVVLYHVLLAAAYIAIIFLVIFGFLPPACLIVFLSLAAAIKAFSISRKNYDKVYELLPANAATIKLHSLVGLLLFIGILLDKLFIK